MVPADAEFAATLNVRPIVETGLLRDVIDRSGNPQIDAHLNAFKNLTGLDIWNKDLEKVHVFGQIDRPETILVAIEGQFDRQKLTDLVKLNEQYKDITIGDRPGFTWFDKNEKRTKFGLFTQTGMGIVANSEATLNAALAAAREAGAGSGTPSALHSVLDQQAAGVQPSSALWGSVVLPERLNLGRKFPAASELQSFSLQVDLSPADLTPIITTRLSTNQHAQQWLDLSRGGAAMLALQSEVPTLAKLAQRTRIEPSADNTAVISRVTVERGDLMSVVSELKAVKENRKARRADKKND